MDMISGNGLLVIAPDFSRYGVVKLERNSLDWIQQVVVKK